MDTRDNTVNEETTRTSLMIEHLIQRAILKNWRFSQSGLVALMLQECLQKLPSMYGVDRIDEERIVDYFVYQIYRNRQWIAEGRYDITWAFSPNARSKFKYQFLSAAGKSGMNYYMDQWLSEHGLTRGDLLKIVQAPKPNPLRKLVYLESEEPIKLRFHNTEEGFALCQHSTTGWSPLSEACKSCSSWEECGKNTATKYPELMRMRKEAYYGNKEK